MYLNHSCIEGYQNGVQKIRPFSKKFPPSWMQAQVQNCIKLLLIEIIFCLLLYLYKQNNDWLNTNTYCKNWSMESFQSAVQKMRLLWRSWKFPPSWNRNKCKIWRYLNKKISTYYDIICQVTYPYTQISDY